jgi:hypothetical protein
MSDRDRNCVPIPILEEIVRANLISVRSTTRIRDILLGRKPIGRVSVEKVADGTFDTRFRVFED